MKVALEEIESVLLKNKIESKKVNDIIKELTEVVEELKNDKDTTPKEKYEHIIVLNDQNGYLKDKEIAGWVVQQVEDSDADTIISKLKDAAKNQNEITKKKANLITDLTSLFEHLKSKFTKEKKIKIKTKELTRVIITDGKF